MIFLRKEGISSRRLLFRENPYPEPREQLCFLSHFCMFSSLPIPRIKLHVSCNEKFTFFLLLVFALHNKPEYLWSIPRLVRWMSMMRTSQWCAHKWVKSWRIAHDAAVQGRDLTSVLHHWKGPIKQGRHQMCWLLRFEAHCIEDTPGICWVVLGEV